MNQIVLGFPCPKCHKKGQIFEIIFKSQMSMTIGGVCVRCGVAFDRSYDLVVILFETEECGEDDRGGAD